MSSVSAKLKRGERFIQIQCVPRTPHNARHVYALTNLGRIFWVADNSGWVEVPTPLRETEEAE